MTLALLFKNNITPTKPLPNYLVNKEDKLTIQLLFFPLKIHAPLANARTNPLLLQGIQPIPIGIMSEWGIEALNILIEDYNITNFQAIILGSDQGRKVYKKKLIDLAGRSCVT